MYSTPCFQYPESIVIFLKQHFRKTLWIIFPVFLLILSSGCEKKSGDCPALTASASSPVEAGGTISLTADISGNVVYYYWTGPNGFTSTEQNPVITGVQSNHAGRYTVEAGILDGCVQSATTDSVIVTVPASPCSPVNNTGNISGASSLTFSTIYGGQSGGSYFITANGSNGDLELEFPGTSQPVAGVYRIQPLGGSWLYGDVGSGLCLSAQTGRLHPVKCM